MVLTLFLTISIAIGGFVSVHYGDVPVLIAAEHDGYRDCGTTEHSGITWNDINLSSYRNKLIEELRATVGDPYIVRLECKRKWVDGNRYPNTDRAYNSQNTTAKKAFFEYHDAIDDAIANMESKWGDNPGVGLNIHTFKNYESHGYHECLVGFDEIKSMWYVNYNSAKNLYDSYGVQALRQFYLHINPVVETTQFASMNGQATVSLHGTNTIISPSNYDSPGVKNARWRKTLDFVQIENYSGSSALLDIPEKVSEAVKYMLENYYGWTGLQECERICIEYETICR